MRPIWEVFTDPEDKDRRLFVAGKNSNARDLGGPAFRIVDSPIPLPESGDFVGRVEWQAGLLNVSADDIAFQALDTEDRDPWPIEWLRDYLKGGPRSAREGQQAARQEGIPVRASWAPSEFLRPPKRTHGLTCCSSMS